MKRELFQGIDPEQQLHRDFARPAKPFEPSKLTAAQKAAVHAWVAEWRQAQIDAGGKLIGGIWVYPASGKGPVNVPFPKAA